VNLVARVQFGGWLNQVDMRVARSSGSDARARRPGYFLNANTILTYNNFAVGRLAR
jgi:hypothetical protein